MPSSRFAESSKIPMRFLVTGGAGFLGINLVRYLLNCGEQIRSLDIAPFDYPEKSRVNVIGGDIRDPATVDRAISGTDIVVHCAAALPLCDRNQIFSTEEDGTRVLLERALVHNIARFIFISSTAVYGIPDHHPICEYDALHGVGPYGEAKIRAEEICREYRSKGLCVSILRPKTFVGPERLGVFELLYSWAYEGRNFPVIGSGNNHYQLLDVEDLCQAIELCATRDPQLVNDDFNVGARQFGTLRQEFQAILDHAGHGKRVIGFPACPATVALRLLRLIDASPLYPWIYDTMAKESVVSVDRIEKQLGFTPLYSSTRALIRNYDWYVANRPMFQGKSGMTHRVPWNPGVLRFVRFAF
jgi:nucleoside-diphosphate-sugar epimerase